MRKLKTIQCRCGLQVNMIKSYTLCPSCNNPLFYTTEDQQQCFAKFYKGQVVASRYITKGSIVESSLLLGMSKKHPLAVNDHLMSGFVCLYKRVKEHPNVSLSVLENRGIVRALTDIKSGEELRIDGDQK